MSYSCRLKLQEVRANQETSANISAERVYQIGWKPMWNRDMFLQSIDDEIQNVLDLGKAKSSLIDSLFDAAKE